MKIRKFFANHFSLIWNHHCKSALEAAPASTIQVGYGLITDIFQASSNTVTPLFWGYHAELGLRMLVIFIRERGTLVRLSYCDIVEEKKSLLQRDIALPRLLKQNFSAIGHFRFVQDEIAILQRNKHEEIMRMFEKKSHKIAQNSFDKIWRYLNTKRSHNSHRTQHTPRSVWHISAGLPELGKNRRH